MRGSPRSLLGLIVFVVVAMAVQRGVAGWRLDRLGAQIAAAARPGDIVMLSSETCVYCAQARRWMTAQRVPFDECFIERDAGCADRFAALQGSATPLVVVRGRRMVGFRAEDVAGALQ